MTEVRPTEVAAGITLAASFWGLGVFGVPGVLDDDDAVGREELAVAGVAGREHTIEHVDAARDALYEVVRHPGPHQIARAIRGQLRSGVGDDVVHDVDGFTDAEAANRVRLESDLDRGLDAFGAERGVGATLDNSELRLPGIGDDHVAGGRGVVT